MEDEKNMPRQIDWRDPRFLYIVFFAILLVAPMIEISIPIPTSPWTQDFYDTLEGLPPNSNVVIRFGPPRISSDSYPYYPVLFKHLLAEGHNIVLIESAVTTTIVTSSLLTDMWGTDWSANPECGYGTRFVYLGYLPGAEAGFVEWFNNPKGQKAVDAFGTSVDDIPLAAAINDGYDIDCFIALDSGFCDYQPQIISYGRNIYGYKLLWASNTAIATSRCMTIYVVGDIDGMIAGVRGGAELSALTGIFSTAQAYMNGWVFLGSFVIIGLIWSNITYILIPRLRREEVT